MITAIRENINSNQQGFNIYLDIMLVSAPWKMKLSRLYNTEAGGTVCLSSNVSRSKNGIHLCEGLDLKSSFFKYRIFISDFGSHVE